MNQTTPFNTFWLSREELVFALRSLGLPDLPGLGKQPLGDVDAPTAALLAEAARRALIARGMLQPTAGGEYGLDKNVQAALTLSTYPERMLTVSAVMGKTEAAREHFYRVPELTVHHYTPQHGIHAFDLDPASTCGLEGLLKLLDGTQAALQSDEYALIQERMDEAYNLAGQDAGAAAAALSKIGMPAAHAAALAGALAAPELRLSLQYVFQVRPDVDSASLTFLAGAGALWQVRTSSGQGQIVHLQAIPAAQAGTLVKEAHQKLLG